MSLTLKIIFCVLSCQALEFLHNDTKKVRITVSDSKLHLFVICYLCLGILMSQSMLEQILTYPGRRNPWEQGCEVRHPEIWPENGSQVSTNILLHWSPCPCCPHWCSIVSMASLHHSCWLPHREDLWIRLNRPDLEDVTTNSPRCFWCLRNYKQNQAECSCQLKLYVTSHLIGTCKRGWWTKVSESFWLKLQIEVEKG